MYRLALGVSALGVPLFVQWIALPFELQAIVCCSDKLTPHATTSQNMQYTIRKF